MPETSASLAIVECQCSDEWLWSQRINGRKSLRLPEHHQTDWDTFKRIFLSNLAGGNYTITDPLLVIDTVKPFQECFEEALDWIEQLVQSS